MLEMASLFPAQGHWSVAEYLYLTDETRGRVELADRRLEFLPMPTEIHEALARFLFLALYSYVSQRQLGEVYASGIRVKVCGERVRLPDVVFLHKDHYHKRHNRVWDGADLVMEVVSGDSKDRDRDYQTKLADYAAGGIAEYWIIDPTSQKVLVHRLVQDRYTLHGEFAIGEQATSALLAGFAVDVTALFDVMKEIPE